MSERRRVLLMMLVMATASFVVAALVITMLYRTALKEERAKLMVTARSQARLIEAVARFDAVNSRDYPRGSLAATMVKIREAHENFAGFGNTGEVVLSRIEGERIRFLLSRRKMPGSETGTVPLASKLAVPMRLALSGKSGTVIGLDYSGEKVMAAHEPVAELGLGMVVKIDLAEIRSPFIRAGASAAGYILFIVFSGATVLGRVSSPMVDELRLRNGELTRINRELSQEIRDREEAQKALARSEERFRELAENMGEIFWSARADLNELIYVSPAYEAITGRSLEQMDSGTESWLAVVHPEDLESVHTALEMAHLKGLDIEFRIIRTDAAVRWIRGRGTPVRGPEGVILRYIGIAEDITGRKRSRIALKEEQTRFRALFEGIRDALFVHTFGVPGMPGTFSQVNDVACRRLGYSRSELLNLTPADLCPPEHQDKVPPITEKLLANGNVLFEHTHLTRSGDRIPVEIHAHLITLKGNPAVISIARDITERKKADRLVRRQSEELERRVATRTHALSAANRQLKRQIAEKRRIEERLRRSKKTLQAVFDGITEPLFMVNRDLHVRMINSAARSYFTAMGGEKGTRHPFLVDRQGAGDSTAPFEIPETVFDGEPFMFERVARRTPEIIEEMVIYPVTGEEGVVTAAIIRVCDVTETRILRQQLMQSEKLASVGELAAGVAHEVNNPINGVMNYAELLIEEAVEAGCDDEIPRRILKESERIAAIVKGLLSFARDTEDVFGPSSVLSIVSDTLDLVAAQFRKEGIRLHLEISDDLPPVQIDREKIRQVFLNLFSNARYALNLKYPRFSEKKELQIRAAAHFAGNRQYIRVTVFDRGTGIPPEVVERVFDPFYSTKPPGEGTGLGLSISYGIIRDHKGKLSVESEYGCNTRVIVDLPVVT